MEDSINTEINEKELKKALIGFNFGSATPVVGIIWSVVNGCFKKYAVHNLILLFIVWTATFLIFNSFMPLSHNDMGLALLGWLVCLIFWESLTPIPILFIYNGIFGNNWAWKSGKFKTIQEFKKAQIIWNIVGGCIAGIAILGIIVIPSIAINSYNKEQVYISEHKCILLNDTLPPVFNKLGSNFDLEIFANEWNKNNKVAYTQAFKAGRKGEDYISATIHNRFIVSNNRPGYKYLDLYFVQSQNCDISKGNCYVYIKPESYERNYVCKFYFNDNGRVIPSNSTKKFIDGEK